MLCPLAVYVVSGSIVASVGVNPSQTVPLFTVTYLYSHIHCYVNPTPFFRTFGKVYMIFMSVSY